MKKLIVIALACTVMTATIQPNFVQAKTLIFQPKDSTMRFWNKSGWTANYTFSYTLNNASKVDTGAVTGGMYKVFSIPKDAKDIIFKAKAIGRGDYTINQTLRAEDFCIQAYGTVFNPSYHAGVQCLSD